MHEDVLPVCSPRLHGDPAALRLRLGAPGGRVLATPPLALPEDEGAATPAMLTVPLQAAELKFRVAGHYGKRTQPQSSLSGTPLPRTCPPLASRCPLR